jgi:RNA polymerase subunit RPABC4/transcription elongation factor Spt4
MNVTETPDITALPPLHVEQCPYCGNETPQGPFCGACGAHLAHAHGPNHEHQHRRRARRHHSFAAFPNEHVLRLSAVTSLFPHLGERSRGPFRAGLAIVIFALAVFSIAQVQSAVIAVSAVGVPVLFELYVYEIDPFEQGFLVPMSLALLIGAGLGTGWALIGGPVVARASQPSLTTNLTSSTSLVAAVLVPIVAQLLMILPVLVLHRTERSRTETLDGFVAGGTAALGFMLAATFTNLSGDVSDGIRGGQPVLALLTEAGVRGFALPVTAALATGTIGAALWRIGRRPPLAEPAEPAEPAQGEVAGKTPAPVYVVLAMALGVALLLQVGMGFAGLSNLPDLDLLAVYASVIAIVIIGARAGIHWLLLTDAHHVRIGRPRVCANCHHLVPEMPFCPVCGVSEHATPRSHRTHPGHLGHLGTPAPEVASD